MGRRRRTEMFMPPELFTSDPSSAFQCLLRHRLALCSNGGDWADCGEARCVSCSHGSAICKQGAGRLLVRHVASIEIIVPLTVGVARTLCASERKIGVVWSPILCFFD